MFNKPFEAKALQVTAFECDRTHDCVKLLNVWLQRNSDLEIYDISHQYSNAASIIVIHENLTKFQERIASRGKRPITKGSNTF